jgi:hypothetical protein
MAITAKNSGCRASNLAGLPSDSIAALEFDLGCSLKLLQWENECQRKQMEAFYRIIYIATNKAFAGGELPDLFNNKAESLEGVEAW